MWRGDGPDVHSQTVGHGASLPQNSCAELVGQFECRTAGIQLRLRAHSSLSILFSAKVAGVVS